MYGGLFGDLPAAKGEKRSTSQKEEEGKGNTQQKTSTKESSTKTQNTTSTTTSNEKHESSNTVVGKGFLIPNSTTKKIKAGGGGGPTLTQSIGTAGTTMAFIPTTIKRKKQTPHPSSSKSMSNVKKPAVSTNTTATPTMAATTTTTTTTTTTIAVQKEQDQHQGPIRVVDIHAPQHSIPSTSSLEDQASKNHGEISPESNLPHHPAPREDNKNNKYNYNDEKMEDENDYQYQDDDDDEEEEPITDPYDPYVPNDLLQYWDREAKKEEQWHLEQEAQRALEQQRVLRKRLEEERQELLSLQQQPSGQGEYGRGFASRLETTGRGRGLSNLPAWYVAQQQQQQQQDRLAETEGPP